MNQIRDRSRLKNKIKLLLVNAEQEGMMHTTLIDKCRTRDFPAEEIRNILQDWNTRQLVQCFEVKKDHSKKPVMIWRATRLILTERL